MSESGDGELAVMVKKVESIINSARRHLADGKMIDLGALEGKVEELCRNAVDRARGGGIDRDALRAAMAEIIESLDHLANEITLQYDELAGYGKVTPGHAAQAYGKPPGER